MPNASVTGCERSKPHGAGGRMSLIVTLVIGGLVGWFASVLMKTNGQMGIAANVVVGVVGAFLGGVIAGALGLGSVSVEPLGGLVVAIGGAVALIALLLLLGIFDRFVPAR
jgi:uncharacterized membrane protein YeaQ/YmgE (transglycosylase-associated protein family)